MAFGIAITAIGLIILGFFHFIGKSIEAYEKKQSPNTSNNQGA